MIQNIVTPKLNNICKLHCCHFAPAYSGGSDKLGASLEVVLLEEPTWPITALDKDWLVRIQAKTWQVSLGMGPAKYQNI